MEKKMWKQLTAAAAVAVMVGTACAGTAFAEEDNGMVRSYLTGKLVPESIGRTKAISVMLNNIQAALPQSGIANAEVVYEAPVEGGITRLMGIFEDYQDVERIGSVPVEPLCLSLKRIWPHITCIWERLMRWIHGIGIRPKFKRTDQRWRYIIASDDFKIAIITIMSGSGRVLTR